MFVWSQHKPHRSTTRRDTIAQWVNRNFPFCRDPLRCTFHGERNSEWRMDGMEGRGKMNVWQNGAWRHEKGIKGGTTLWSRDFVCWEGNRGKSICFLHTRALGCYLNAALHTRKRRGQAWYMFLAQAHFSTLTRNIHLGQVYLIRTIRAPDTGLN